MQQTSPFPKNDKAITQSLSKARSGVNDQLDTDNTESLRNDQIIKEPDNSRVGQEINDCGKGWINLGGKCKLRCILQFECSRNQRQGSTFPRKVDFMRWFPMVFLANGTFNVTIGGIELTNPVL